MKKLEKIVNRIITESGLGQLIPSNEVDGICSLYELTLTDRVIDFLAKPIPSAEEVYNIHPEVLYDGKKLSRSSYKAGRLSRFLLEEEMMRLYLRHEKRLTDLFSEDKLDFGVKLMKFYGFLGEAAWYLAESIKDQPEFLQEVLERARHYLEESENRGNKANENYHTSSMVIYRLLKVKTDHKGDFDPELLDKFLEKSLGFVGTFESSTGKTKRRLRMLKMKLHSFEHLFEDMAELFVDYPKEAKTYGSRLQRLYDKKIKALHERVHGNLRDLKTVVFR